MAQEIAKDNLGIPLEENDRVIFSVEDVFKNGKVVAKKYDDGFTLEIVEIVVKVINAQNTDIKDGETFFIKSENVINKTAILDAAPEFC